MSTNYTNFNNTNCSKSSCSQRDKLCPDHSCKNYHCHQPPGPETPRDLETYQHPLAIETPRSASIPVSGRHSHFEMVHVNDDNISKHLFQTLPCQTLLYIPHIYPIQSSPQHHMVGVSIPFLQMMPLRLTGVISQSHMAINSIASLKPGCWMQVSAFLKPPKHCIIYKGPCFDLHVFYLILTTTAPQL